MRILVITQHYGRTAPGLVFESLIVSLSKIAEVDLITCNYEPNDNNHSISNIIKIKDYHFYNNRLTAYINRLFNLIFGFSWRDYMTQHQKIRLANTNYNAILCCCSAGNMASLSIGIKLKRKYGIPIGMYLVDAYPTPYWWNPSIENRTIGAFLKRKTELCDYFASSNPLMLEYQKKYLSLNIKLLNYIHTPSSNIDFQNKEINSKTNNHIFIYMGGVYGIRIADNVLEAFTILIKDFPNAKLLFVGTNPSIKKIIPESIKSNVEILPYTQDLTALYTKATALIDIDANVNYDVFLSSKISNYIFVNKPIICETGEISPSRNIFSQCNSILLCSHNSKELYMAMTRCVTQHFDFTDRDEIKQLFNPDLSAQMLLKSLDTISRI